jgi:hypothetical protein
MNLVLVLLVFTISLCCAKYIEPTKAGVFLGDISCRLDPRINETSITDYKNGTYLKQIFKYLWASACGRSRGVFTISDDPAYAGTTYSCANWPEQWGINQITDWF